MSIAIIFGVLLLIIADVVKAPPVAEEVEVEDETLAYLTLFRHNKQAKSVLVCYTFKPPTVKEYWELNKGNNENCIIFKDVSDDDKSISGNSGERSFSLTSDHKSGFIRTDHPQYSGIPKFAFEVDKTMFLNVQVSGEAVKSDKNIYISYLRYNILSLNILVCLQNYSQLDSRLIPGFPGTPEMCHFFTGVTLPDKGVHRILTAINSDAIFDLADSVYTNIQWYQDPYPITDDIRIGTWCDTSSTPHNERNVVFSTSAIIQCKHCVGKFDKYSWGDPARFLEKMNDFNEKKLNRETEQERQNERFWLWMMSFVSPKVIP